MRKALLVAVLPILLLMIVARIFESMQAKAQQSGYCHPAAVFYAMADVKSVHFTGWYIHSNSGEKKQIEGWIKDGSKLRIIERGGPDTYCDGSRFVELHKGNGFEHATIRPVLAVSWHRQGQSYLKAFTHAGVLFTALKNSYLSPAECRPSNDSFGTPAIVVNIDNYTYPMTVTVDADSWLPLKWEEYDPNGRLVGFIHKFEYDVEIPDSVFQARIPQNMPVIDLTSQSATAKSQQDVGGRISSESGAKLVVDVAPGDRATTKLQPKLVFESIGPRGFALHKLADGKTCRVVGKAYVYEQEHSWSGRIFEDEDIDLTRDFASTRS